MGLTLVGIGTWLKNVVMLPGNLAKVANLNKSLELQRELAEAQRQLDQARKRLAKDAAMKTGSMFFHSNVVWAKDAEGRVEEAPYCPRCFELDGKPVHLAIWHNSMSWAGKCLECKADGIVFLKPNEWEPNA